MTGLAPVVKKKLRSGLEPEVFHGLITPQEPCTACTLNTLKSLQVSCKRKTIPTVRRLSGSSGPRSRTPAGSSNLGAESAATIRKSRPAIALRGMLTRKAEPVQRSFPPSRGPLVWLCSSVGSWRTEAGDVRCVPRRCNRTDGVSSGCEVVLTSCALVVNSTVDR